MSWPKVEELPISRKAYRLALEQDFDHPKALRAAWRSFEAFLLGGHGGYPGLSVELQIWLRCTREELEEGRFPPWLLEWPSESPHRLQETPADGKAWRYDDPRFEHGGRQGLRCPDCGRTNVLVNSRNPQLLTCDDCGTAWREDRARRAG